EARKQWYQRCLKYEAGLAAFGPLFSNDPAVQFSLQAARRNLGDFETATKWYTKFRDTHSEGCWRDAAAAELWLNARTGPPPKPVLFCCQTAGRPYLDGRLEDACWQGKKPNILRNAVGETAEKYPTEVRLAYDRDFLYLALRC